MMYQEWFFFTSLYDKLQLCFSFHLILNCLAIFWWAPDIFYKTPFLNWISSFNDDGKCWLSDDSKKSLKDKFLQPLKANTIPISAIKLKFSLLVSKRTTTLGP